MALLAGSVVGPSQQGHWNRDRRADPCRPRDTFQEHLTGCALWAERYALTRDTGQVGFLPVPPAETHDTQ